MFKIVITILLGWLLAANAIAAGKDTTTTKPNQPSWANTAYGAKIHNQNKVHENMQAINLYMPNFVLPFYYTQSTPNQIYASDFIRGGQRLLHKEFEGQISIKVPVLRNVFHTHSNIYAAYTQLVMWQFYAKSQYFRETDYMPEVFLEQHYGKHWLGRYAIVHQSNGRGIPMERSWNRVYAEGIYSNHNLMISVKPWWLVFQHASSTVHNPDITHYMGHGRILMAYKMSNNIVLSLTSRNNVESNFKRGYEEVDMSFPLFGHFKGYIKVVSGYGQTLIEYNHYTNAVGIGVVLNDWI